MRFRRSGRAACEDAAGRKGRADATEKYEIEPGEGQVSCSEDHPAAALFAQHGAVLAICGYRCLRRCGQQSAAMAVVTPIARVCAFASPVPPFGLPTNR